MIYYPNFIKKLTIKMYGALILISSLFSKSFTISALS